MTLIRARSSKLKRKAFWIENGRHMAGLAAAGVVGAGLAVLANAIYRGGADAGDWLQFFGGMLGAGLAVVGAVYFEDRRRRQDQLSTVGALELILRDYAAYIDTFRGSPSPEGTNLMELMAHLALVVDHARAVVEALNWLPAAGIRDLDTLRRVQWLKDNFDRWLPSFTKFCEVDPKRLERTSDEHPLYLSLLKSLEPNSTLATALADRLREQSRATGWYYRVAGG